MKVLETEDGTITFHNEEFDQHYHTKSGAYEEAVEKHVAPAKVQNDHVIVDFCFGLGYNTLAAIEKFDNLYVTALEIDAELFTHCLQIRFVEPIRHSLYQNMMGQIVQQCNMGHTDFEIIVGTSTIRMLVGDAASEIKKISSDSVNAIFFDPFSPQVHAALWSESVFKECYRVMKQDARLTTYSCARMVRDNMKSAGLRVEDGPVIGRRSPSTIAVKNE